MFVALADATTDADKRYKLLYLAGTTKALAPSSTNVKLYTYGNQNHYRNTQRTQHIGVMETDPVN